MNSEIYPGKFFGPYKISKVELLDEKTYLNKPKVKVFFDDGHTDTMPLSVLEACASEQQSDLTILREKRVTPVVLEIMAVLVDSELTYTDIGYLIQTKVKLSVDDAIDRAEELLWHKPKDTINLMDVEKVLRQPHDTMGTTPKTKRPGNKRATSI